ncbi:MAG: FAD-dependent oxidoreductase [Clostridiales Family XIII bacterium]|jgi:2,4-dienoyl-CoA reductase-like NADH-dependent reductase (Old Yellow Enzyme family)/thioredoxin reductase|nr:FAD-dependent oxidoreductase [Clostridiales Family XIII bacterium]
MTNIKYPHLFEPVTLGGTLFRNRIFAAPTGCIMVDADGGPTPEGIAFYERKAVGGAAAVTVGDCIIDSKTGQITPYQVRLDEPRNLPRLSSMAESIYRHGAVASVELQHGGMYAHLAYERGGQLLGPVDMAIPDERKVNNDGHIAPVSADGLRHIKGMTEEDIDRLITSFVISARLAKQCGFGMIMIHAGHGWGLAQFLSPKLNTRKDRWGGDFEGRIRLPLAVIDAVRREVGAKFPIEVRISGAECTDDGYDTCEGVRIAKALDGKADLIHVSAGHHESVYATMITHPSMFLADGCNVKYAAEVKKHVSTPVATVGALTNPEQMEEILASGKADVVEIARALLADPDLPKKAREGKPEEINECMRCCTCLSNSTLRRRRACAINPEIGREQEVRYGRPAATQKRVVVIGGGVAGMEAAITASKRGHEVYLFEKNAELGGVLLCERSVPFKARLGDYLGRQTRLIEQSNIELNLSTQATQALIGAFHPDVIIAALGARPIKPSITGIDGANVLSAEDIYLYPDLAGAKVSILGGGLVGVELAIYLTEQGHEVTIFEMQNRLNYGGNVAHGQALDHQIADLGIKLELGTAVSDISSLKTDTVIYAVGQKPLREEADQFRLLAPEFHQIGDCLTPENIIKATEAAFTVAMDI